jgi:hypothetical protein
VSGSKSSCAPAAAIPAARKRTTKRACPKVSSRLFANSQRKSMLTTTSQNSSLTNSDATAASGHHVSVRSGSQSTAYSTTDATISETVTSGNRRPGRLSFIGSRAGEA